MATGLHGISVEALFIVRNSVRVLYIFPGAGPKRSAFEPSVKLVSKVTWKTARKEVRYFRGNVTIRLDVPANTTIADLAGNLLANQLYTSGDIYTVNKTDWIYLSVILR